MVGRGLATKLWISSCLITMNLHIVENALILFVNLFLTWLQYGISTYVPPKFAVEFLHVQRLNWWLEGGVATKLWISSYLITMNLHIVENALILFVNLFLTWLQYGISTYVPPKFAVEFLHVQRLNWWLEGGVATKLWISSYLITMKLHMVENASISS